MARTPKLTGFFEIVPAAPPTANITDNQDLSGSSLFSNNSWYQRIVQGSSTRLTRYREYDSMDETVEIARALDTIAEEMTGYDLATNSPLLLDFQQDDERIKPAVIETLRSALRVWVNIHNLTDRMFDIARSSIKYGDCFFIKGKLGERWVFVHARHVLAANVNANDVTDVRGWLINTDYKEMGAQVQAEYNQSNNAHAEPFQASNIVRFSHSSQMSDSAPFGDSVLRPVYKAFKQQELLEDAIIIYRITRAPERRVFYMDTGKLHQSRVKQYLETVKNELKQKKIPTRNGAAGSSQVESIYNPQSMTEDFFFAQSPNGKGSRVEVLPGGSGLGELSDLEYFQQKVFRGLRIPTSYMPSGQSDNPIFSDGRIGQSYIEELRFALYVGRLQKNIERTLTEEFIKFLSDMDIQVDPTLIKLRLPEAANFGKYRQQELDSALLGTYSNAEGSKALSQRFMLGRYLQLSAAEIATNERLVAEERGIDPNDPQFLQKIYSENADDMDGGGLGDLGTGGDFGMDMSSGLDGDLGDDLDMPDDADPTMTADTPTTPDEEK